MRIVAVLLSSLLLLSACAEKGAGPIVSSGERYAAAQDDDGNGAIVDYKLGAGDKVKVTVYHETDLTGEYTVSANGTLSLPLIGEVPARDHTVREVAAAAQARYADGYLRSPKVSAEVTLYRPFYILGEVTQPGTYPYVVGLTAFNAVATAKGFTPRANRDVVQIRRQGDNAEVNYKLTPELHVYPGDTIRVGERYF